MSKFEIGTRVVDKERSNLESFDEDIDDTVRGVVESVDESETCFVKWDGMWHKPNPEKIEIDRLITEVEANEILSSLEKEYELWAKPVKEKIKEAAKLLAEAASIAHDQKKDLSEMHNILHPLVSAMDNIGWNTSSLSC